MVPLENAEGLYVVEPVDHATPETLFERRWALTVVDGLLSDLRAQWSAQRRAAEFDELKGCLVKRTQTSNVTEDFRVELNGNVFKMFPFSTKYGGVDIGTAGRAGEHHTSTNRNQWITSDHGTSPKRLRIRYPR